MRARKKSSWKWLDSIPAHWDEGKVVFFARLTTGGTPDRDNSAYWEGGSIPWVASGEVNQRRIRNATAFITQRASLESNAKLLPTGAVLVALAGQGKTKGMAAVLELSAAVNQSLAAFLCDERRLHNRFLYYYLTANYRNLRGLVGDDVRDGLSLGHLSGIRCPVPPVHEQRAIADFLDRKTAAVDVLIEDKKRLVELHREKLVAVATQVLTRGLDTDIPARETRIEWLDRVPAHWELMRTRFIFRLLNGFAFAGEHFVRGDVDAPVLLTPGNFHPDGGLYFENGNTVRFVGTAPSGFQLSRGDYVVVLTDLSYKKLILGRCAPVDLFGCLLNQRVAKLVLLPAMRERVHMPYLCDLLNSPALREQVVLTARGTTVFHTSPEKLGNVWTCLPPVQEQQEVASFVATLEQEHRVFETKQAQAMSALAEYRQALINAAVTGQLDVSAQPREAA